MNRTNKVVRTSVSETATQNDFNLKFDYSNDGISEKPTSVNVIGSKVVNNQTVTVNAAMSANGMNVSFNPSAAYDATLVQAVVTEMTTILNTEL